VLCYHAVSERWPASLSVPPEALEGELRFLSRSGFKGETFDGKTTTAINPGLLARTGRQSGDPDRGGVRLVGR
jgi:hypothetical protein